MELVVLSKSRFKYMKKQKEKKKIFLFFFWNVIRLLNNWKLKINKFVSQEIIDKYNLEITKKNLILKKTTLIK